MSGALPVGTLPTVANPALEPASVRNGSPAVKQAYNEALGFESVLVNELCQQLISNSGLSDSGSSGDASDSDPTVGGFTSMLPGALSSAIMSDGGLGLAAQLLPTLEGTAEGATSAEATP
jgi:Rod binding domain-containing protein